MLTNRLLLVHADGLVSMQDQLAKQGACFKAPNKHVLSALWALRWGRLLGALVAHTQSSCLSPSADDNVPGCLGSCLQTSSELPEVLERTRRVAETFAVTLKNSRLVRYKACVTAAS